MDATIIIAEPVPEISLLAIHSGRNGEFDFVDKIGTSLKHVSSLRMLIKERHLQLYIFDTLVLDSACNTVYTTNYLYHIFKIRTRSKHVIFPHDVLAELTIRFFAHCSDSEHAPPIHLGLQSNYILSLYLY